MVRWENDGITSYIKMKIEINNENSRKCSGRPSAVLSVKKTAEAVGGSDAQKCGCADVRKVGGRPSPYTNAIKYLNPETRRILTSRNYKFLTNLPVETGTPEPIHVELPPAVPCEGEHDGGNLKHITLQPESQCTKKKREREDPHSKDEHKKQNKSQRILRN